MYHSGVLKIGWEVSISRIRRQTRWWSVEMCCFDEKAMLQRTQEKKKQVPKTLQQQWPWDAYRARYSY
jgi:hypothetical protein